MKVYDAKGIIVGRLAAKIAKELLENEEITVVNVADATLSGNFKAHKDRMTLRKSQIDKRNPQNSPKFPKLPRMMFKRIVRGMLPKNSQRGRDALKRLVTYDSVPETINKEDLIIEKKLLKQELKKSTTLGKLCSEFGYDAKK